MRIMQMQGGFGVKIGTTLVTLKGTFRGDLLDPSYGFSNSHTLSVKALV